MADNQENQMGRYREVEKGDNERLRVDCQKEVKMAKDLEQFKERVVKDAIQIWDHVRWPFPTNKNDQTSDQAIA